AIGVQFTVAVVYPGAGNLGGGGFMVVHTSEGESNSIDFRETAPATASRDMYLDEDGMVIPRRSLDGHLAAGIPGTVAGAYLAHEKYGKMPKEELIAPAVQVAEKGFVITALEAENLNESHALCVQVNTDRTLFDR